MRQCEVYLHGIKAGTLTEHSRKEFTFEYDHEYMLNSGEPVSLTLPLREEPYRSSHLFPAFANMLSEGSNRQIQSQILRIDSDDDFSILMATCQLDTIGAITIKPIDE